MQRNRVGGGRRRVGRSGPDWFGPAWAQAAPKAVSIAYLIASLSLLASADFDPIG